MKLNNINQEFAVPKWLKIVITVGMLLLMEWNIISSVTASFSISPVLYYICVGCFIIMPALSILYELKRLYYFRNTYFKLFTIAFSVGIAFLIILFISYDLGWFHSAIFAIEMISLLSIIIDRDIYLEKSFLYGMGVINPALINIIIFAFRASKINSVINITSLMITNLVIAVFYIFMLYSRYRNSHLKIYNKDDQ